MIFLTDLCRSFKFSAGARSFPNHSLDLKSMTSLELLIVLYSSLKVKFKEKYILRFGIF